MKKIILLALGLVSLHTANAQQDNRVITTGVPFLMIAADARAAGMADQGVATSSDVYSMQWNPAKYAFALREYGVAVSYTPYLTGLSDDIALSQINFYNKFAVYFL